MIPSFHQLTKNALFLHCPPPPPLRHKKKSGSLLFLLHIFLKHGQMDFFKSSNSISHHLTSIFPENCQIFWVGSVGHLGYVGWVDGLPAWVSRPERPKGAKDEVGARRAPN